MAYVRSGSTNRLVDDIMLRYMFEHLDDPRLSLATSLFVWYNRKPLIFSPIEFPRYMFYMLPFLQELTDSDTTYLYAQENENIPKLILEMLPYALLNACSTRLYGSWLSRMEKTGGVTTVQPVRMDLPSETVNTANIPIRRLDISSKLSIDIKAILSRLIREFKIPKDTAIEIQFKGDPLEESILVSVDMHI
jgi:hypothetical protein